MNHQDHVRLLEKGVPEPGGVWADLGAGDGAFTLALAELIGATGTIYAVDRDEGALRRLVRAMQQQFPAVTLHTLAGDFSGEAKHALPLPPLDGVVMANSLHFIRHKAETLARVRGYLKPEGRLLMVEYNSDQGNVWVPHPFSYPSWERLSRESGFGHTELLATYPSRFLREIYAAASW
jgi:ubiquinone/menaquinone biosynthesis C-methylase UbiE